MDSIQLQFSTSMHWQSGVIRLATRSEFSHVDLVVPPGIDALSGLVGAHPYGLLGASDPGGVAVRPPNYHQFRKMRRMTLITDAADAIFKRAASQLGKPFDQTALYRSFDRNWTDQWRDDEAWFCVELIAWVLVSEGFWDHRRYPVDIGLSHITPEDLIKYLAGEYDPEEFRRDVDA